MDIVQVLNKLLPTFPSMLFSIGSVVLTGTVTYFFTARHFKKRKWYEFDEKRLNEFYGPLVGRWKIIEADNQVRLKVSAANDASWKEICKGHPKPFLDHAKYFAPYEKSTEYDNKKLEYDLKLYDEMVTIFEEKIHYAFPSTKEWFSKFSQFVELWHRYLEGGIPSESLKQLRISEKPLLPFYEDLEKNLDRLVKNVSGKRWSIFWSKRIFTRMKNWVKKLR